MNSITTAAPVVIDIAAAAAIVAAIVALTKFIVKRRITGPDQNKAVRLYVYIVSLAVVASDQWFAYQPANRQSLAAILSASIPVAGLAISYWHVLTSDTVPTIPLGTLTASWTGASGVPAPASEPVAITQPEPGTPPAAV